MSQQRQAAARAGRTRAPLQRQRPADMIHNVALVAFQPAQKLLNKCAVFVDGQAARRTVAERPRPWSSAGAAHRAPPDLPHRLSWRPSLDGRLTLGAASPSPPPRDGAAADLPAAPPRRVGRRGALSDYRGTTGRLPSGLQARRSGLFLPRSLGRRRCAAVSFFMRREASGRQRAMLGTARLRCWQLC